jgi:hypothetical protein
MLLLTDFLFVVGKGQPQTQTLWQVTAAKVKCHKRHKMRFPVQTPFSQHMLPSGRERNNF